MYQDATQEYQRYLDQFPRTAAADRQAAYYRLAESYRNTGSLNNAKANYETLLSSYPDGEFVGYAAYRLGTILYEEKDYRGALPVYRRASVRLRQPTLIVASKFFDATSARRRWTAWRRQFFSRVIWMLPLPDS